MHMVIVVIVAVALVVGCKGKQDGAGAGSAGVASGSGSALAGSGSGSGSASTMAGSGSAGSGSDVAAGSGSAGSAVATPDEPEKPASRNAIVGIDLEWPAERVVKVLGAPTAKSTPESTSTAGGAIEVSKWTWASQPGLTIKIATDDDDEPHVYAMQIDPPSTIKTPAGIGIGATRAEVKKAYPDIQKGPVNNLYTDDLADSLFFDFGKDKSAKAKVVSILRTPIEDSE